MRPSPRNLRNQKMLGIPFILVLHGEPHTQKAPVYDNMGCCNSHSTTAGRPYRLLKSSNVSGAVPLSVNGYHQRLLLSLAARSSFTPSATRFCDTAPVFYPTNFRNAYGGTIEDLLRDSDVSVDRDPIGWHLYDHRVSQQCAGYAGEKHCDREVTSSRHIGTVFVIVPSEDAVGGRLKINGLCLGVSDTTPYVVFIPRCVKYEVTALTQGSRVVAFASVSGRLLMPKDALHRKSQLWRDYIWRNTYIH
jgi:hypothetical protein